MLFKKIYSSSASYYFTLESDDCIKQCYPFLWLLIYSIKIQAVRSCTPTVISMGDLGPAITDNATEIIICHNHPLGTLEASQADIQITDRLKEVTKLVGIEFAGSCDHQQEWLLQFF